MLNTILMGTTRRKIGHFPGEISAQPTLLIAPAKKASEDEIREAAREQGMKTLFEDGLLKAKEGVTTLEEVIRVTGEE